MSDAAALLARLRARALSGHNLESGRSAASDPLAHPRISANLARSRETLVLAAKADQRDTVERLIADARLGFAKLAQDGPATVLTRHETLALEAVIETDGSRPVMFVQDGTVDGRAPELADWGAVTAFRPQIERVVAAVGRIDSSYAGGAAGTGFMIAPGLIVTNRHVLELIAAWDGERWGYRGPASIDFRGEHGRSDTRRFKLGEVVFVGEDPINFMIDFARLDVAIIRLEEGDEDFPAPLSFERRAARYASRKGARPRAVQVIGFPARPEPAAGDEGIGAPPPGEEYAKVMEDIFRSTFGVKRWAPGEIRAAPGQLEKDDRCWVFSHDASTLGGSSGSAIVDLCDNGERVLGIHFGGRARDINWGHAFAALKPHLPTTLGMAWL